MTVMRLKGVRAMVGMGMGTGDSELKEEKKTCFSFGNRYTFLGTSFLPLFT